MNTPVSAKQKQLYARQGYLILRSAQVKALKKSLKDELKAMALGILKNHPDGAAHAGRLKSKSFADIFNWCISNEKDNAITRTFYELFPTAFSMIGAVGDPYLVGVSRELGLVHPVPSTLPILRIDRPAESRYLTPVHQDFWYSMLSPNSLTYWFPLLPVTPEMGDLLVVPGSHKNGNLPIKEFTNENPYALRDDVDPKRFIPVNLKDDEVLVFSQYLIHQSGVNRSDKAHLTLQVRHNDLHTLKALTSSFTPKHSVFTARAQKEWLEKSRG